MKKLITLVFALAIGLTACAQQLTVKEVLKKAVKATPFTEGITGNVSAKTLGMGETMNFSTNVKKTYIASGDEQEWINDGIVYTVNTKDKTLTIEDDDAESIGVIMPYMVAAVPISDNISKQAEVTDLKMKTSKSEYEVDFKMKGQAMELYIDSKTFYIKSLKIKKGFITVMSFTYSNLKKLTNQSVLNFDRSKYSSYKVIDQRGKTKTKTTKKTKK